MRVRSPARHVLSKVGSRNERPLTNVFELYMNSGCQDRLVARATGVSEGDESPRKDFCTLNVHVASLQPLACVMKQEGVDIMNSKARQLAHEAGPGRTLPCVRWLFFAIRRGEWKAQCPRRRRFAASSNLSSCAQSGITFSKLCPLLLRNFTASPRFLGDT